jgi:hypothetical protein
MWLAFATPLYLHNGTNNDSTTLQVSSIDSRGLIANFKDAQ